jgi:pimeloyl-ACP methyl ester carboxylesterase
MKQKFYVFLVVIISLFPLVSCKKENTTMVKETVFQDLEVQTPEVTLYARVAGHLQSGNVLIAIHGGPGNSSDYMVSLGQLAGDDLAVVIYDQRGTGKSTDPGNDPANYALLNYVNDLEAVRAAAGIERVFILGHSWGGVVAQRYATLYPQRIRALILMGSGATSLQAVLAAQEGKRQRMMQLQERGIIPKQITSLQDILPAYFSDPYFDMPAELKSLYYNGSVEQYTWTALGDFDFTAETKELVLPALVLYGKDDPFGSSLVDAAVSSLSNAKVELVLLEKCGHYWHECPDQFFPRVRDFLKASGSIP